jgi:hypothetical protein
VRAAPQRENEWQVGGLAEGDIPTRRDSVVCTELDSGEIVLLDLDSKYYYSANETGRAVWQCIDGRRRAGEIVEAVAEAYDGDAEEIRASVMQFLQDLVGEGLIDAQCARREEEPA